MFNKELLMAGSGAITADALVKASYLENRNPLNSTNFSMTTPLGVLLNKSYTLNASSSATISPIVDIPNLDVSKFTKARFINKANGYYITVTSASKDGLTLKFFSPDYIAITFGSLKQGTYVFDDYVSL